MITCRKLFQLFLVFFILLCETCVFVVHSTGGAPQIKCVEKERQALLNFKQGLTGMNNQLSSWGTEEIQKDCCKWQGVKCDEGTGNVISLVLVEPSEPLTGVISPSLLELKYLEYLDFSYNSFSGPIPVFFGSFTRLKSLRLSDVGFKGGIPHELGNLSSLDYLDLSRNYWLSADNLQWLLPLQSLRYLHLDDVDLSKATDWLKSLNNLPLLDILTLESCRLPPVIPSLVDPINTSTSLTVLYVSHNNLGSSIYTWLFNYSSSLSAILLSNNSLQGPISDDFSKMVSLELLDLSYNKLNGSIPGYFSNYSRLKSLYLHSNLISGPFPELSSSLRELDLRNNLLTEISTESIGRLSNLQKMFLGSNQFKGVISESHMLNLSKLDILDFSMNPHLEFRFHSDWVPPFQLDILKLQNCKIGPYFPKWLQTQKLMSMIDMSATGISGDIPSWFRDQMSQLLILNLSYNRIGGTLPKLTMKIVDLSSNDFEGPVPQLAGNASSLNLSKNRFLGKITDLCNSSYKSLLFLDLSDNQLFGQLPDCWGNFGELVYLNLANNNLSGKIPPSMGSLSKIEVLQLRNNSFTEELPQLWKASKLLNFIDFGRNNISGAIPSWIGSNLSNLVVLSLSSNNFSGSISEQICHLSQIQILDLSNNNIFGTIPKCIYNFSAMTREGNSMQSIGRWIMSYIQIEVGVPYVEEAFLTWKGRESQYKSILGSVKIIDLSSNNLAGVIPLEVTSLVGLVALNLSRNHLTGILMPKIGELKLLEFLDLSRNRLSGQIPSSLSQLSFLGVLNLSFNDFTGRIPWITHLQTFDASTFEGNLGLCGKPLTRACPGDKLPQNPNFNGGANVLDDEEHEDKLVTGGFYLSMVLGFILGFCCVCGTLFFNRSCRHSFFRVLNEMEDWLYTMTALKLARLQRWLQG